MNDLAVAFLKFYPLLLWGSTREVGASANDNVFGAFYDYKCGKEHFIP